MFPGKDILRSAVLVAIGGIVALLVSKLLESDAGEEAEAQRDMREIRRDDELNEAEKQPREHDERTCWEDECGWSHIKHIVARSDLDKLKIFDLRAAKTCHAKILYRGKKKF